MSGKVLILIHIRRCQPKERPMLQSRTLWLRLAPSRRRRRSSPSPPCLVSPPHLPPTPPSAPYLRRRQWETAFPTGLLTARLLSLDEEPPPSRLPPLHLVPPTSNSHQPQSQEGCLRRLQPVHSRSQHLALLPPTLSLCPRPTSSSRWAPRRFLTGDEHPAGAAATLATVVPPLHHILPRGPSLLSRRL